MNSGPIQPKKPDPGFRQSEMTWPIPKDPATLYLLLCFRSRNQVHLTLLLIEAIRNFTYIRECFSGAG